MNTNALSIWGRDQRARRRAIRRAYVEKIINRALLTVVCVLITLVIISQVMHSKGVL